MTDAMTDDLPVSPPTRVTGEPRVDATLARLAELDERPLSEQVAVYDDIHRRLQDALTDPDGS